MDFDLSSAKPVAAGGSSSGGFDLSSAQPVDAKPAAAPKAATPPPDSGTPFSRASEMYGGLPEAGLSMAGKMGGAVAGNVAGLGAIPLHAAGLIKSTPEDVKAGIQNALDYQPKGRTGKGIDETLGYVGRGIGKAGDYLGGVVAPPGSGEVRSAAGRGTAEAFKQLPGLVGLKSPALGEAASGVLKDAARGTMQSALKPTLADLKSGKAAKGIDMMLDEGINVDTTGLAKLRGKISDLNDRIATAIADSPATIDKHAVASRLKETVSKFEKQVTPLDDVRSIQKAWDEFIAHPLIKGDKMSVQDAQMLKQGTYKSLGDKAYGELKGADIEAQKTLARGLKEEIAKAVPAVHPLNAAESRLLNGLSMVERRVLMEANKNPAGLGWLTTSPSKFAAYMADRSGLFKSLIARMLNKASTPPPPVASLGMLPPVAGVGTTAQAVAPPPQ
jgi:hypothetical protein